MDSAARCFETVGTGMSILTHGLIDYDVPDFRDEATVIPRLSSTEPDLLRVRDYWRSVDSDCQEAYPAWTFIRHGSPPDEWLAYRGPGGFSVHFGPRVACIGASCRFSGFATISSLQVVHLFAFKHIARMLGGTRLVLMPEENGPIWDAAMFDGASLDECVALIRKTWGDPHPRTEVLTDDLDTYYRRKFPVWYLEKTP
jgi:hypothetical protein